MPARTPRLRCAPIGFVVVSILVFSAAAKHAAGQFSPWGYGAAIQQPSLESQYSTYQPAFSAWSDSPRYEVAGLRHHHGRGATFQPGGSCNSCACYPTSSVSDCTVGGCCGQPSAGSGCCGCDCCGVAVAPPIRWLGSIGVLALDREDENHRFFSYDDADESFQLLDSRDSNFDYAPGVEAHLMCWNACTNRGTEAVYWGIFPDDGFAYADPSQVTGNLNGIFNFDQLDYNGNPANIYVDNAMIHRLRRETEIHNIELNHIWGLCCAGASSSCWTFGGLAGFRYFRLGDELQFAADTIDTTFTGAVEELYYTMDVENDLFGVQFGALADRRLGCSRWSLTFGAKAGVFVNSADARSTIGGAAGIATINNGPNLGAAWDIASSKEDLATIAEIQAGAACRLGCHWRVRGDYRVIGITGVALPTHQIYQDLRGIQDVQILATGGDLILHGLFVGLERNY